MASLLEGRIEKYWLTAIKVIPFSAGDKVVVV
jgi:hypothetical protein